VPRPEPGTQPRRKHRLRESRPQQTGPQQQNRAFWGAGKCGRAPKHLFRPMLRETAARAREQRRETVCDRRPRPRPGQRCAHNNLRAGVDVPFNRAPQDREVRWTWRAGTKFWPASERRPFGAARPDHDTGASSWNVALAVPKPSSGRVSSFMRASPNNASVRWEEQGEMEGERKLTARRGSATEQGGPRSGSGLLQSRRAARTARPHADGRHHNSRTSEKLRRSCERSLQTLLDAACFASINQAWTGKRPPIWRNRLTAMG